MPNRSLKPMPRKTEMALFANALNFPARFLAELQANPTAAKQLGRTVTRARRSFATAYPNETRTRVIPNVQWQRAGHFHIAAINRALGLKGC